MHPYLTLGKQRWPSIWSLHSLRAGQRKIDAEYGKRLTACYDPPPVSPAELIFHSQLIATPGICYCFAYRLSDFVQDFAEPDQVFQFFTFRIVSVFFELLLLLQWRFANHHHSVMFFVLFAFEKGTGEPVASSNGKAASHYQNYQMIYFALPWEKINFLWKALQSSRTRSSSSPAIKVSIFELWKSRQSIKERLE